MPTFDFKCPECGHKEPDVLVRQGETPEVRCPLDGTVMTKSWSSPPAAHFKGPGWTPIFGGN